MINGIFKKILKNEPAFRYRQIEQYIYQHLISSWEEASALPKKMRLKLKEDWPLIIPADFFYSVDQRTIKALITLIDKNKTEAVLMRHKDHNTVCVSSQVGCSMACDFCATGKIGFKRNLTCEEIINQVLLFSRLLKKENQRVDSVVFMGMGEPFLNFDNVIESIEILNDKNKFNIGARHISISTCGIIPGIKKIAHYPKQINLAISLHAPNEKLRTQIMPINREYHSQEVLDEIKKYIDNTNRKVMVEYVMLKTINDSEKQAKELALLLKKSLAKLFFVNLIEYNFNEQKKYQSSSIEQINKFRKILEKNSITVTQRFKMGKQVSGACGQLAAK